MAINVIINKKLFRRGEVVAVAVSGGKDSMCLLNLLLDGQGELGVTVKAINIEHGIRGETSVRDSEFVADYCEKRGVELKSYKLDCKSFSAKHGYSEEEGARIARYSCFYDALNSGYCDKVATAHHLSDTFETTLFNLFRGSSSAGVSGINETRDDGRIIRPLSAVSGKTLAEYASERSIPFVQDETNFEDDYSRNYIRNRVIPVILERFPEAERSVARFCELERKENGFLNGLAEQELKRNGEEFYISVGVDECVFARATVIALKRLGVGKDYEKSHIDAVLNLVNRENGKFVTLPKGVVAVREYDKVVLYRSNRVLNRETPFSLCVTENFAKNFRFETTYCGCELVKSGNRANIDRELNFDFDKIPSGAVIRAKRDGDVFVKFGGKKKKLCDYFTDVKIPLRLRDSIPLVCYGNEVLIVCGVEISDNVKVDDGTVNVTVCKPI